MVKADPQTVRRLKHATLQHDRRGYCKERSIAAYEHIADALARGISKAAARVQERNFRATTCTKTLSKCVHDRRPIGSQIRGPRISDITEPQNSY
jgi:hypothetical protein